MKRWIWVLWVGLSLLTACRAEPAPLPPAAALPAPEMPDIAAPAGVTPDAWLDASVPGMTFGGATLYFCHGINIGQARTASSAVKAALVAWPDGDPTGILAAGELRWPAPAQTLADLDTLANAGLQPDLCVTYGDFWPRQLAVTKTANTYYTALAMLDGAQWRVRIALVQE